MICQDSSQVIKSVNNCQYTLKFATKPIQHYPPHLATLPWEIKNSNFWPPVNFACVPQRF